MNTVLKKAAPALALLGLMLGGCQPELDAPKASGGSADFSRYLAVGNSLTAGYSDNGLYLEGQQNSYPNILAQQFRMAGGGDFVQPLFAENQANGSGYLRITGFTAPQPPATPSPIINSEVQNASGQYVAPGQFATGRAYTTSGAPFLARFAGSNQNLGVPGIRIADITTPNYGRFVPGQSNAGNFNPYFERLLSGADQSTYLQYVTERVGTVKPTFFTNWLGNNDVLGFASSGGTAAPLTPVAEFSTKYNQMVDVLTADGAKGLVATIPTVTNVPYFTTVNAAAVRTQVAATPIPAAVAAQVVALLGFPAGTPLPTGSRFALYITTGTNTKREVQDTDLLLLPASAVINTTSTTSPFPNGIGLVIPGLPAQQQALVAGAANALPSSLVLDEAEAAATNARTTELNAVIKASADRKGLAVFDSNEFFRSVAANGIIINGTTNTAAFVSGNLFSLDGVHPTPRGYAVIANEMIRAINSKYGASVSSVDPNAYRGVRIP